MVCPTNPKNKSAVDFVFTWKWELDIFCHRPRSIEKWSVLYYDICLYLLHLNVTRLIDKRIIHTCIELSFVCFSHEIENNKSHIKFTWLWVAINFNFGWYRVPMQTETYGPNASFARDWTLCPRGEGRERTAWWTIHQYWTKTTCGTVFWSLFRCSGTHVTENGLIRGFRENVNTRWKILLKFALS